MLCCAVLCRAVPCCAVPYPLPHAPPFALPSLPQPEKPVLRHEFMDGTCSTLEAFCFIWMRDSLLDAAVSATGYLAVCAMRVQYQMQARGCTNEGDSAPPQPALSLSARPPRRPRCCSSSRSTGVWVTRAAATWAASSPSPPCCCSWALCPPPETSCTCCSSPLWPRSAAGCGWLGTRSLRAC